MLRRLKKKPSEVLDPYSTSIHCEECLLLKQVKCSNEFLNPKTGRKVFSLNSKITLGSWHSGIGQSNINKLFNEMDLPNVDNKIYKAQEHSIGPVVELIAKESCTEAVALERVLTEQSVEELKSLLPEHLQENFLVVNLETGKKPIVRIFVLYDMGWSQRGNRHTYDSLNGYMLQ